MISSKITGQKNRKGVSDILETELKIANNYKLYQTADGQTAVVNKKTGEIEEVELYFGPKGTQHRTPEEQAAIEEKKKAAQRKKLKRDLDKELGDFYFIRSKDVYEDVKPVTMTRLILLATYMKYDSTQLMKTERTPLYKEDLQGILGVSATTFWRFWKEVNGKYVTADDKGVYMSEVFFWRGSFTGLKENKKTYKSYQRAYIDAIRDLYARTPSTRHVYLGYVFRVLAFVNYDYNIICHNPLERDLDHIQPMTLDEFCEIIGYAKENRSYLLHVYSEIQFCMDGGNQEDFLAFVFNGTDIGTAKMFVNPRIMFRGSGDWRMVSILGTFCKAHTSGDAIYKFSEEILS